MSEGKGTMLAKSMQKHAGRAKEKILQNLGKVDRTADEIFDDHLNNFNRQQTSANKLQKEFNNYIRCIRAAQLASKLLMDAVCEVYEPQWVGYDALQAQTSASESLWQDFAHKLGDQVLIPLNTYTGQFPEMKKKVEKRNRKLIDYDGQRHSFQSLQANSNKRKDEAKINKGREQLEEARRTYEILNTELHDELPALYDSRILFLVTNLQTLFATEQVFHNETAKIYSELEAIVDKLATESQRGSNTLRKQTSNAIKSSPVQSPVKQMNNSNLNNANNYQNQITTNGGGSSVANSPTSISSQSEHRYDSVSPTPPEQTPENLKLNTALANAVNNTTTTTPPPKPPTPNSAAATTPHQNNQDPEDDEPKYENTTGNNDVHNTIVETPSTTTTTPTTAAAAAAETSSETNTIVVVPQSPNANSVVEATVVAAASDTTTTTTNTIENDVIAVSAAVNEMIADKLKANEEAIAKEAMDRSQNNSSTKAAEVAVKTTTTTVATTTTKVARNTPQIPTEQLNGNGNTTTTTATTTPPSSQSNGNIEENNKKSLDLDAQQVVVGVLENSTILSSSNNNNNNSNNNNSNSSGSNIVNHNNDNNQDNNNNNNNNNLNNNNNKNPFEEDECVYEVPKDATTTDLPPGVLYRVKATYGYVKEDVDELSFEIGDIIRVIEYDDPEDQEEGWLMGQKEGTNEKGLFPANFTRPI